MIVFYSTHCPKCRVLKQKLDEKHIAYDVVTDTDYMLSNGILTVPVLEIDGNRMDFNTAVKWVNEQ